LSRFSLQGRVFYACPDHGILADADSVQAFLKDRALADFCLSRFTAPDSEFRESQRRCPQCSRGFSTFLTKTFSFVHVDVCRRCRVFWFDSGEWEQVKAASYEASIPRESFEAAKSRARPRLKERDWLEREQFSWTAAVMPIEESTRLKARPPILTYMIAIFSFFTTAMALSRPGLFERWAFLPQAPFAQGGTRLITSIFLHAGWLHFCGNVVFLTTMGDDCEDEIGHWDFLKLFVLSGLAGHAMYLYTGIQNPTVGMSGAVAGIMSFYGIRYPDNRIRRAIWLHHGLRYGYRRRFLQINISPRALLVTYVSYNLLMFYLQSQGLAGHINYAAHVGGFAAGAILAWWRD
jgi:membrane associated rhomboid family serine protease